MTSYRITSSAGMDMGVFDESSEDAARALGTTVEAMRAALTVREVAPAYTIEQRTEQGWTSEGIGESAGWPDLSSAIDAMRSLADLGEEWHGEYRVTCDGRSVHRETIGG